jgi:selT/selW/selH-like putative selenoprotein
LEATLARELGVKAKLIRGDNGVFDVVADGRLVFSKHAEGRFPEDSEVVRAIRALA